MESGCDYHSISREYDQGENPHKAGGVGRVNTKIKGQRGESPFSVLFVVLFVGSHCSGCLKGNFILGFADRFVKVVEIDIIQGKTGEIAIPNKCQDESSCAEASV